MTKPIFELLMLAVWGALLGLLVTGAVLAVFHFLRRKQVAPPRPLASPSFAAQPAPERTQVAPKCPHCGVLLAADAPQGLCPACLAKMALGSAAGAPGATGNVNPMAEAAQGTRVPPAPAQLAAQFPQLEILELLGVGGMGMVYKARQPRLDRLVALKILPVAALAHASFAERFEREAKALARLNHPGIVTLHDFGQTADYYYFVMEYVDGMNLRQLMQAKTMQPRQALELVTQICTALQFAHDESIVHRDIKPENILITKKGQVKIADFGLAKLLGAAPDTSLTASQMVMGTLNYMAPEQRESTKDVDHRADIYSLGVVFYEMLTGQVPLGRFEPPSKKVQVDVRLDEVVLHALEREPERRYQHVSEVKTSVETIAATTPAIPSAVPVSPAIAIPRPTLAKSFVRNVLKPGLWWLASLMIALIWPSPLWVNLCFFMGVCLLVGGLPAVLFEWRWEAVSQGLAWRQLPPAVRRRGNWRLFKAAAPGVAILLVGSALFPGRWSVWREESFDPKSGQYAKIHLAGHITSYQIPFWSQHTVAASGSLALKMNRQDSTPELLTVSLPGLQLVNDPHDPGQDPGVKVLTMDVLVNWLHDRVGLEVARPEIRREAKEITDFLDAYREAAPGSWAQLNAAALKGLPDFALGDIKENFGEGGIFGGLIFLWVGFPVMCAWLFCFLALRSLPQTFAEAQAEIAAGCWTPPKMPSAKA